MDEVSFKKSLAELTDQLLYSSETDYPFGIIEWNKKNLEEIKKTIIELYPADTSISTISGTEFFNSYIHNLEMSGDEVMIAIADRYKKLQSFIGINSNNFTVWKCGRIEIDIYITIETNDANIIVLKTTSIET
jgi:cystathionine beta-lyase family protein involved in aluminum resistance